MINCRSNRIILNLESNINVILNDHKCDRSIIKLYVCLRKILALFSKKGTCSTK